MTDCLVHRGPDDGGMWYDQLKGIYLGHRRLSIIDIAGGAQPMWSADGTLAVAFNGEIYNHMALRRELEKDGYVFKTDHSDTEILLHGFRKWGNKLPDKLNGMWSFLIYSKLEKKLFCARDRFGKKPLFLYKNGTTIIAASEIKSILRSGLYNGSVNWEVSVSITP